MLTLLANHHEKSIICQLSHLANNEKFGMHKKHNRCIFHNFSTRFAFCNHKFSLNRKKCIFCVVRKCIFMIFMVYFSPTMELWWLIMLWIIYIPTVPACARCWTLQCFYRAPMLQKVFHKSFTALEKLQDQKCVKYFSEWLSTSPYFSDSSLIQFHTKLS